MKNRLIAAAVAIVLMIIVIGVAFGGKVLEKYSYGTEEADLTEYFGVSGDELAIVSEGKILQEKALSRSGRVYFDLDLVRDKFTDGFFYDGNYKGGTLMYTTAIETYEVTMGESSYFVNGAGTDPGYTLAFEENGEIWIEADYLRMFAGFKYESYEHRIVLHVDEEEYDTMKITKDTQIRRLGGIKSPILAQLTEGDSVILIESMEDWSKVATYDGLIGYVENKRMTSTGKSTSMAPDAPALPEYTSIHPYDRISLGFHALYARNSSEAIRSLESYEKQGMNVISPSWFWINDASGSYKSLADKGYVDEAHKQGLLVWAMVDDFNYAEEPNKNDRNLQLMSDTNSRRALENSLISDAVSSYGVDGLVFDMEYISEECNPYYIQFLREMSVLCRNNGIVLAACHYTPLNSNNTFRYDIQGQILDYVIMMGYDEHWGGSGDPGSVASIGFVMGGLDRLMEQMPAEKIIDAVPLYMRLWKSQGTEVSDWALAMNSDIDQLQHARSVAQWDDESGQNYATWQSGNATYQIWIEDKDSITSKLQAIRSRNLAGVATWRLGYGTKDVWELISMYLSE
ncbi:MAG: SH3 domain-containing protein [Lachnospiraceae bacterium]|nr:SH3 domain-containing protein [Lachnospiraceae bacterium]